MIHILILKILGVILLSILGILLLLVFAVLFLPFRYRLKAVTDNGTEGLNVNMRITWLFRTVTGIVKYNDKKANAYLKVLGKCIELTRKKDDNKEQKDKPKFDNIKCTNVKIYDTIKMIFKTKEQVVEFLEDEVHLSVLKNGKNEITQLAKRIRPRKIKGYVRFGLKDPYNTGQVLAVLSVLYPFYGESVEIFPEFEKEILEGDVLIEGHIRMFHLLVSMCKIIFDKNFHKTVKDIKSFKR